MELIQGVRQGRPILCINKHGTVTRSYGLTFGRDSFMFHVIILIFKYLGGGEFSGTSGCMVDVRGGEGVDALGRRRA